MIVAWWLPRNKFKIRRIGIVANFPDMQENVILNNTTSSRFKIFLWKCFAYNPTIPSGLEFALFTFLILFPGKHASCLIFKVLRQSNRKQRKYGK